jgi:hypothetical protein
MLLATDQIKEPLTLPLPIHATQVAPQQLLAFRID